MSIDELSANADQVVAVVGEPGAATVDGQQQELLVEELLVEEVSIDGMCGVY